MKANELPLIAVFNSLRQDYHLPLGIDDYMVVLRALQLGINIDTRQDIEQLCSTVWAKSITEKRLVEELFKRMWIEVKESNSSSKIPSNSFTVQLSDTDSNIGGTETIDSETVDHSHAPSLPLEPLELESSHPTNPLPTVESSSRLSIEMNEPTEVVQAIKQSQLQTDISLQRPRYRLISDYFPVTYRQMKQIWRYLRQPVREGIATELDIDSTVHRIGYQGVIFNPMMRPPISNRANLVLMIDQEGSMVPFHLLSQQLIETAQQSGRLKKITTFYFHNYPGQYLYRKPTLIDHQSIAEILEDIGSRTSILIVSDAGSARGNYNSDRVELTSAWIDKLNKRVQYIAWLNPMPMHCWEKTTAEGIARLLPMFEMSREGMSASIDTLRGRYIPWRKRYLWKMK